MKKFIWFVLSYILAASLFAEEIKTYIVIPPLADEEAVSLKGPNQFLVRQPTEEELDLANKILDQHIRLSVKTDYQNFLGIKKDPTLILFESQTPAEVAKEKTLGPAEAVAGPPDEAKKMQDHLNGIYGFLRDSEFQLGLGAGIPLSSKMAREFNPGLWGELAYGLKLSDVFALTLDFQGGQLTSHNDSLTDGGYGFAPGMLSLTAKYRFAPKGIRPYVFAGPGLSIENYNYNYLNGNFSEITNYSDIGFGLVGGVGVDVQVDKIIYLYAQTEMYWSTTPSDVNGFIPMDNPISIVPIEVGILFGR
jgi:hypothetical protein